MNENVNISHIEVVSSPPGSGKTTWAINEINKSNKDEKFIVVTPFLKECDRIIESCPKKNFVQPDARKGKGKKRTHFLELIQNSENIVSTHSLFSNIDDEIIEAIKATQYTLILDEVFGVVEKYNIYQEPKYENSDVDRLTRSDIKSLAAKEYIIVEDDFRITWNNEYTLHKYEPLKRLADRGLLYLVNDSLLLWSFPVEVFREGMFANIFILTFQFNHQIQYYYYSYFGLKFDKYHIETIDGKYTKVKTINNEHEKEWIKSIAPLINICEEKKLNAIGSSYMSIKGTSVSTTLSKNWYKNNPGLYKKIRNNSMNFIRNYSNKKTNNDIMWTCFKENQIAIGKNNLAIKHFVSLNSRATNEYGHKHCLIYLINRYINPFFTHFFFKRDIIVDEECYALSELLQWLMRSRLRNGESVDIFCPSERMREMLQSYLSCDDKWFK